MIKVKEYSSQDLIQLRKKLDLNQSEFWQAINVTQSGGSRYESGRKVPDQVLILVELVHESEPTRVFRRQFILSHATLADSSNWR